MNLNLNSQKNIKKFYKKLWLYKSIIFFKTKFTYNGEVDLQTKYIVEALNIKKRKERITFVFDKTCEVIDKKYEGINICGFCNRVCERFSNMKKNYLDGCCRYCLYITPNGCPSKNVGCKLFNCTTVKEKYDVYEYKDLPILKILSLKNRIIIRQDLFSLRDDVLKDLYSYSFIYSSLRMLFRISRNFYKKNKLRKQKK